MKSWIKPAAIAATSLTLLACGSSLIWKTTYSSDYSSVASALAVDDSNQSYVGGGLRLSGDSIFNLDFNAALLKFDDSGVLLWDVEIPGTSKVKAVKVLSPDLLLVATDANYTFGWNADNKTSDLWLVSSVDGSLIKRMDDSNDYQYVDALVANGHVYIASSSAVSRYSLTGELLGSLNTGKAIQGLDVNAEGALFVAYGNLDISKLDEELGIIWTVNDDVEPLLSECGLPRTVRAASSGLWLNCYGSVLRLSENGSVSSLTSFSDYLINEETDEGQLIKHEFWVYGWRPNLADQMIVDANDDLYVTASRVTVYGSHPYVERVGGVMLGDPSVVETDAVIFKVSGASGEIIWVDDVNTPFYGNADGFVSYFYYPLALHLDIDDQPLLTFRGIKAKYLGYEGVESYCTSADGLLFYVNLCHLDEYLDLYAKTVRYDAATGKRLADARHAIDYPRATALNSNDEILIVGDGAFEILDSFSEFYSRGLGQLGEDQPISESSSIVLEKHQL